MINDLSFIIIGQSISKIAYTLEKAKRIVLKWDANNTITFNNNKTEAILFFKAYWQKFIKLLETEIRISGEKVLFK